MLCLQIWQNFVLPYASARNLIVFFFLPFSQNKLDGYVKEEESGKELSSEQQKAISKYDEVVQQLSLSKEFCKQFQGIASAAQKDAKREARKVCNNFSRPTSFETVSFQLLDAVRSSESRDGKGSRGSDDSRTFATTEGGCDPK